MSGGREADWEPLTPALRHPIPTALLPRTARAQVALLHRVAQGGYTWDQIRALSERMDARDRARAEEER